MAGRLAWPFWFLPLRFQQPLIAKAYQQRIERARFEAGLLRELIAVLPDARLSRHDGEQLACLRGTVWASCHAPNINIYRVSCQERKISSVGNAAMGVPKQDCQRLGPSSPGLAAREEVPSFR